MSDDSVLNPPFEGPHAWVQWKGTNVCMDVYCGECGKQSHFDGWFAYCIECPYCGATFEVNGNVKLHPITKARAVNRYPNGGIMRCDP